MMSCVALLTCIMYRLNSYDASTCHAAIEDGGSTLGIDTSLLGPVAWRNGALIQFIGEVQITVCNAFRLCERPVIATTNRQERES